MLIIKIFVNERQIDDIHIQNVGQFDDIFPGQLIKRPNVCVYKIRKPVEFEDQIIFHERNRGHRVLTSKVMEIIKHSRGRK